MNMTGVKRMVLRGRARNLTGYQSGEGYRQSGHEPTSTGGMGNNEMIALMTWEVIMMGVVDGDGE